MSAGLPIFNARVRRLSAAILAVSCVALVAACNSTTPKVALKSKSKSKEYFSEAEYGVKASPRVAAIGATMPSGGGRYQVGKPYQVKGRWYRPKEDPDYVKVGAASWYGEAFHGRLTANGEVYDMMRLSAAHPTMPLPSYARVTNVDNGSSLIVRVNDRGPFAHNRVIDLSKRAAQLLDYQSAGVAKVKVEYVGPAPIEGQDDQYLMASYNPGSAFPDPSDGLPSGVMIAMNGTTPSATLPGVSANAAFASQPGLVRPVPAAADAAGFRLPSFGPIVPQRPLPPANIGGTEVAALSYADQRVADAARAFDQVLDNGLAPADVQRWWKSGTPAASGTLGGNYINAGSWTSREAAERQAERLAPLGAVDLEAAADEAGAVHFTIAIVPDGRMTLDRMLKTAWAAGATDAFIVRQ